MADSACPCIHDFAIVGSTATAGGMTSDGSLEAFAIQDAALIGPLPYELATLPVFGRWRERAFLCRFDPLTNTDFSHRKAWIRDRMKELAAAMAIDVLDYAVLDNHLTLGEYLLLPEWTGRELRADKRGVIPAELQPILERLQIQPESWLDVIANYDCKFRTVVGRVAAIRREALRRGRRWLQGLSSAAAIFL